MKNEIQEEITQIRFHYMEAVRKAEALVEKMARDILRQHKNLDEFVMAMGGGAFFCLKEKKGSTTSTWALTKGLTSSP